MTEFSGDLYFKQVEVGPMQNWAYLVGSLGNRRVLIVDPGWQADSLLSIAAKDGMQVDGVLITHCHYDHVNGLDALLKAAPVPVYVHEFDAPYMTRWARHLKPVQDGHQWRVGEVEIRAIHTPGHSEGSQCFLVEKKLLSGDTLFVNACGRTDLPGGDPRRLSASLKRLAQLEDEVVLYPGHDYGGQAADTMGAQKATNPYLRRSLGVKS